MPLSGSGEFVVTAGTLKTFFRNVQRRKIAPENIVLEQGDTLRSFCLRNRDAIRRWYEKEFYGRRVTLDASAKILVKEISRERSKARQKEEVGQKEVGGTTRQRCGSLPRGIRHFDA